MPLSLTLVLFTFLGFPTGAGESCCHALYISTLTFDESPESNTKGRLTARVFSDDLRDAVQLAFPSSVISSPDSLSSVHLDALESYFHHHLFVTIDGIRHNPVLVEAGSEADVTTLTWEVHLPDRMEALTLSADYLMEVFPDQTQMVTLRLGNDQRMFRLIRGASSKTITF